MTPGNGGWTPGGPNHRRRNLLRQARYIAKAKEFVASLSEGEKADLLDVLESGDSSPLEAGVSTYGLGQAPIGIRRRIADDLAAFWNEITA